MTTVHITDAHISPKAWPVAKALGATVTALCGETLVAGPVDESGDECRDCALLARVYDLEVQR